MRRKRALEDLEQQVQDHLEQETQDNIERGLSPEEARHAALRKFGNVALVQEDARAVWTPIWFEQLLQDSRFGLRMLRRNPGFAVVAILTLALGIGMTASVFSVFNAVLLRPLAYPHPDRLVWVSMYGGDLPLGAELVTSFDFQDWQERATSFENMVAYSSGDETLTTVDGATRARVASVSSDFWNLSGAEPAAGRLPAPSERGAVLLSYGFFERGFHGDLSVIGKAVTVDGRQGTITGVLPKGFRFQLPSMTMQGVQRNDVDAYRPLFVPPRTSDFAQLLFVVARLKPNVTIDRAHAELETIRAARAGARPSGGPTRLRVMRLPDRLVGEARFALWMLLTAVAFVLLIACANVANLLLARASARQKEMAIRVAVGAGRARVLRQTIVESLGLALLGCAGGLLLAKWLIATIVHVSADAVPRLAESTVDGRVLALALGTALVTAVAFGSASALTLWTANVHDVLKDGARTSAAPSSGVRLRSVLVAVELALAVVLLSGAGLMVKSFWRMHTHPPGFDPARILTMKVDSSERQYLNESQQARQRAYVDTLLGRLGSVPGVQAASMHTHGDLFQGNVTVEGAPPVRRDQRQPPVLLNATSAAFGNVMGLRMVSGRWITDREPTPVVVLNETLARRLFGHDDPAGRRLQIAPSSFATVVGVVADLRYSKLDESPEAELYRPYSHVPGFPRLTLVIRTTGDPLDAAPAIRTIVSDTDKTQPPYDVMTLEQALADTILPRRFNLILLTMFATTALALALIGIYGVIAYSVAQRTHEIGVRIALGAQRREVLRLVVGQGMRIALVGLVIGLAAAAGLTRLMANVLYDVEPTDPQTFAAVAAVMIATALGACWGPARKASVVDPVIALHAE
jgi:putative ABC transport system permease protein